MSGRSAAWEEPFWGSSGAKVSARRRSTAWMEQQELFPAAREASGEVVVEAAPVAEPEVVAIQRVERVNVPAPAPVANRRVAAPVFDDADMEVQKVQLTDSYRRRDRGVRLDVIAKFLQVNRAVDGVDGLSRFALPSRQFTAKCSLWKGNPVGTPFLTGC